MTALLFSAIVLFYILVPGVLFRTVFSISVPFKKFQRTRTEELTFAFGISCVPFTLALVLVLACHLLPVQAAGWSDYKLFLACTYSQRLFADREPAFWAALVRILPQQAGFLTWYYALLFMEALLLGWLSRNFGSLRPLRWAGPAYEWFARKILLPNISEWHTLLTPFAFSRKQQRRVMADILTVEDHLYRGKLENHFVDNDGRLSGVFPEEALRFDRQGYLQRKNTGAAPNPNDYWKPIPGAKLYIAEQKIVSLNLSYKVPPAAVVKEILKKLGVAPRVTVALLER